MIPEIVRKATEKCVDLSRTHKNGLILLVGIFGDMKEYGREKQSVSPIQRQIKTHEKAKAKQKQIKKNLSLNIVQGTGVAPIQRLTHKN